MTWLSTTGKFFGRLESTSAQDMSRVKEQFDRQEDAAFCLDLARLTVFRKILQPASDPSELQSSRREPLGAADV